MKKDNHSLIKENKKSSTLICLIIFLLVMLHLYLVYPEEIIHNWQLLVIIKVNLLWLLILLMVTEVTLNVDSPLDRGVNGL